MLKALLRWVRTGDEAKIDENLEIWILDRIKVSFVVFTTRLNNMSFFQEIMKVRGFQVAPAELEGCILDHVDVSGNSCARTLPIVSNLSIRCVRRRDSR